MKEVNYCKCEEAYKAVYLLNKVNPEYMNNINIMCKHCESIIKRKELMNNE